LEFNVPFQHKYGYIRDETVERKYLSLHGYYVRQATPPLVPNFAQITPRGFVGFSANG